MNDLPRTMRAVEIAQPGPPSALRLTSRPVPNLRCGEVLIRVSAAGVNRPDVMQRQGAYPPPQGASDLPGLEVAGEIVQVASDVTSLRRCKGLRARRRRRLRRVRRGSCGAVSAGATVGVGRGGSRAAREFFHRVSQRLRACRAGSWRDAAGARRCERHRHDGHPAGQGAWRAGAGHSTQRAQVRGVRCARSRPRDQLSRGGLRDGGRGGDRRRGRECDSRHGGGPYVTRNLAAAAVEGRIALIALLGGARVELDLRVVLSKRLRIMGATLRPQSIEAKGRLARALEAHVWPWFAAGRLRPPPIYARFPLAEAARAHELMESDEHIGKILLETMR